MGDFFKNLSPWGKAMIIVGGLALLIIIFNHMQPIENPEEVDYAVNEADYEIEYDNAFKEVPSPFKPAVPKKSVEKVEESNTAPPMKDMESKFYSIQVSSLRDEARAKMLAEKLQKQGYVSDVSSVGSKDKIWHRVFVGRFATKEEAKSQLTDLRKDYKDCFVKLRNQ